MLHLRQLPRGCVALASAALAAAPIVPSRAADRRATGAAAAALYALAPSVAVAVSSVAAAVPSVAAAVPSVANARTPEPSECPPNQPIQNAGHAGSATDLATFRPPPLR